MEPETIVEFGYECFIIIVLHFKLYEKIKLNQKCTRLKKN